MMWLVTYYRFNLSGLWVNCYKQSNCIEMKRKKRKNVDVDTKIMACTSNHCPASLSGDGLGYHCNRTSINLDLQVKRQISPYIQNIRSSLTSFSEAPTPPQQSIGPPSLSKRDRFPLLGIELPYPCLDLSRRLVLRGLDIRIGQSSCRRKVCIVMRAGHEDHGYVRCACHGPTWSLGAGHACGAPWVELSAGEEKFKSQLGSLMI